MSRGLNPLLETELQKPMIRPVWIIRLDIQDDPVQVWTGAGELSPVGTGDTALDGFTFDGIGNIGEIGAIADSETGSQVLKLGLPGVEIDKDLLNQVVNQTKVWQFKNAWVWFGLLDENTNLVYNPFRVKTGRIDTMKASHTGKTGRMDVEIESHQAYISRTLDTKYAEQNEIDEDDISQSFIHDLANKQPGIGVANNDSSYSRGGGSGRGYGYSGGYGGSAGEFNRQ